MHSPIDFFFDFASPYCYLAIEALPAIAQRHGRAVACHPVPLADLKRQIGNAGADTRSIPAKHRYVLADCRRWARRLGVDFVDAGPMETDLLHRAAFLAADRGQGLPYLALVARALWGQGRSEDAEALLARVAPALGWTAAELVGYASSPAAAERQARTLQRAVAADVFGVPTTIVDGALWWGNDRLPMLDTYLARAGQPASPRTTAAAPAESRPAARTP